MFSAFVSKFSNAITKERAGAGQLTGNETQVQEDRKW
jgi:hypothetical protein